MTLTDMRSHLLLATPCEWRCEAYGVKGNGTGLDADEPLDATNTFAPFRWGVSFTRRCGG